MLDPLDVEAVVLRFGAATFLRFGAATDFALLVEGFGAGSFSSGFRRLGAHSVLHVITHKLSYVFI